MSLENDFAAACYPSFFHYVWYCGIILLSVVVLTATIIYLPERDVGALRTLFVATPLLLIALGLQCKYGRGDWIQFIVTHRSQLLLILGGILALALNICGLVYLSFIIVPR